MTNRIIICLALGLLLIVWIAQRAHSAHAESLQNSNANQNPAGLRTANNAKPSPCIKWPPRQTVPARHTSRSIVKREPVHEISGEGD